MQGHGIDPRFPLPAQFRLWQLCKLYHCPPSMVLEQSAEVNDWMLLIEEVAQQVEADAIKAAQR